MNRLRGPIGMISAWLLVVAFGSAMVWTVISRAGNDLMPAASALLRASSPAAEKSVAAAPKSKPQETGKATLIKSKEPKPSAPSPSLTESAPPVEEASPTSPPTNDPPAKDDDDDHWGDGQWGGDDNKTPPAKIRDSWQEAEGWVGVECVGRNITLLGAQANSGYHVDVDAWDYAIRVVFEDQNVIGKKTFVFGKCYNGAPRFFAKTEGGPGDGGDNSGE